MEVLLNHTEYEPILDGHLAAGATILDSHHQLVRLADAQSVFVQLLLLLLLLRFLLHQSHNLLFVSLKCLTQTY